MLLAWFNRIKGKPAMSERPAAAVTVSVRPIPVDRAFPVAAHDGAGIVGDFSSASPNFTVSHLSAPELPNELHFPDEMKPPFVSDPARLLEKSRPACAYRRALCLSLLSMPFRSSELLGVGLWVRRIGLLGYYWADD